MRGMLLDKYISMRRMNEMVSSSKILPVSSNIVIRGNFWKILNRYVLGQSMFDGVNLQAYMKLYAAGYIITSGDVLEISVYNRTTRQFMISTPLQITDTDSQIVSSDNIQIPDTDSLIWIVAKLNGTNYGIIDTVQLNLFQQMEV